MNKLKCEILDETEGHIVAKLTGKDVWKAFQYESGKHVVQRIPPTETNGRKQTSVVSVGVLPLKEERELEPLPDKELEIICQTGRQKAGGQNVNRVHSAVRMKHIPTGLTVFINGRDQGTNKREALAILTNKVNELKNNEINQSYDSLRKAQVGDSGRSDKIRTYNFLKSFVSDHRFNTKTGNIKSVMKGNFNLVFPKE